jgi:cell division protein FtsB
MSAIDILAFGFGFIGFITASRAQQQIKKLKAKIDSLEQKITNQD